MHAQDMHARFRRGPYGRSRPTCKIGELSSMPFEIDRCQVNPWGQLSSPGIIEHSRNETRNYSEQQELQRPTRLQEFSGRLLDFLIVKTHLILRTTSSICKTRLRSSRRQSLGHDPGWDTDVHAPTMGYEAAPMYKKTSNVPINKDCISLPIPDASDRDFYYLHQQYPRNLGML